MREFSHPICWADEECRDTCFEFQLQCLEVPKSIVELPKRRSIMNAHTATSSQYAPWNESKLVGQKAPSVVSEDSASRLIFSTAKFYSNFIQGPGNSE